MIIVVDGYNVLKQIVDSAHIEQEQRDTFIRSIGLYARRKKHDITIVFDGGPYEYPLRDRENGVCVVYSGSQESADDYIMQLLHEKRGYEIILVSCDRALNTYAAVYDIPSIDSDYFWVLVQQELQQPLKRHTDTKTAAVKMTLEENPELDMIMNEIGFSAHHKHDGIIGTLEIDKNKKSKKERKLSSLLKKL